MFFLHKDKPMEGGVDPIAQYVVDVQFVPYLNTYLTFYTLAIETVWNKQTVTATTVQWLLSNEIDRY